MEFPCEVQRFVTCVSTAGCAPPLRFPVLLYSLSMLPPMVIALLHKERTYFAFLTTFLTFSASGLTGGRPVTLAYSCAPVTVS